MNLGKRIATAIKMAGLTAPDVARASGAPIATLNALMRRDSDVSRYTEAILSALPKHRVNVDWVRTGQGTPEPIAPSGAVHQLHPEIGQQTAPRLAAAQPATTNETAGLAAAPLRSWEHPTELPPGEWVFVPKLGILQSNPGESNGRRTVLLTEEIQAFRASWIRLDQLQPASLAWYDATDASAEPTIFRGDSYVIDTSTTTVVDGKTYAVLYGGSIRPRKLFVLPDGGIRVVPANGEYTTVDIASGNLQTLTILGRVVHRAGKGGL